ncbi:MAG: FtsX-like permease family protein [Chloroflexi bacterium]|nr:FtsX-like permease family protein [Chloroflexota bacterium]MCY3938746.1 FtsX-like permease family protein [Chloroflexota bacterium]
MLALRLRWALRDARARWLQIGAIALMIAIGTGMYAGLSSTTEWRLASNDANFDATNMYDIRLQLGGAGFLQRGALEDVAKSIEGVEQVEERLISQTQVDVDSGGRSVFARGRIIGVDLSDGGPHVNGVVPLVGRTIDESEAGDPVVLLERNFAVFHELPETGELKLGGGVTAQYVGQASSPEYFIVIEQTDFLAQASLAVVFTSLETAQDLSNKPGLVNDLVLTVAPDANIDEVETALIAGIEARYPQVGVTTMRTEDDPSFRALTNDPKGDQALYNVIAIVIFAGAAFASLNLAARMVEAQRREIGTSMALGVPPRSIAARPLLVGLQIGVLGVVFGIGIGLLVGNALGGVIQAYGQLPVFLTPFQTGIFARAAAIGFALPIIAVLWPVYRAVRVVPVDAIRTGHLAARGGGMAPAVSRLPLPLSSLGRMPFRNLLRAPRRTLLTLFALTAVIAILISVVAMMDSFVSTIVRADEELVGDVPDRLKVELDTFYPITSPEVTGVMHGGALRLAEPELVLGGGISSDGETQNLILQIVDFQSETWRPTAVEGELSIDRPGLVLARKAADELGVDPGDTVTLTHPVRTGVNSFSFGTRDIEVIAIHPHPLRFFAYLDIRQAHWLGLDGFANVISGAPAAGKSLDSVKRALFEAPGVGTVRGLAETSKVTRELLEEFASVFRVIQVFVLGLALLIAFNTANINTDERSRDHATMFAYGVPVRRVLGILAMEGFVLGLLATVLAIGLGYALLLWILRVVLPESIPDLGVDLAVDIPTMAVILAAGIAVIALAPALTVRKLRRMDVPATLRVLE